ncbi:hypothetical protein HHI36_015686 [Cryptolaemus montrouzieri]|uniref:WD repeat domain phosphoinositide-interacting protein 2 n=1 Tax=Cryptolaemus montrouzieri TaxID=559131 RepID=A0ABD2N6C4_9CUCU
MCGNRSCESLLNDAASVESSTSANKILNKSKNDIGKNDGFKLLRDISLILSGQSNGTQIRMDLNPDMIAPLHHSDDVEKSFSAYKDILSEIRHRGLSGKTSHHKMVLYCSGWSLAVGSKKGYKLYVINNVDSVDSIYQSDPDDACIIERLFSSSLVAIVSQSAPRKLKVCHFKKGSEICNYSYSNTILSVKLNRNRLVVVLEESLYIHNIRDMKVLHTIRDTPPNPHGLCALSPSGEPCFLAYPGSSSVGEVQIFDASNLYAKNMIHAHDSPLAAIAFSPNGLRIATASEKGTVIRVCSVADGRKLFEFRRGVKRCVDIACLSFSDCGQYLGCSSNTETVHVFKLLEEQTNDANQAADEGSWMGYLSTYLPTQVTDVFKQGRAFATAHMPFYGVKNVLGIRIIQDQLRLLVATEEGILYIYNINPNETGDLVLYKKHHLNGSDNANAGSAIDGTTSAPVQIEGCNLLGSYAGILKGNPAGQMSESDKFRSVLEATATPPKDSYQLSYEQEYPPLTQD